MKIIKTQFVVKGSNEMPMACDAFYNEMGVDMPLIIYAHGFCGFKDWGNFDLVAESFANAGFCFIKFNFSHNGTTVETPEDFSDLKAFAENNFTKELYDLDRLIEEVGKHLKLNANQLSEKIGLLGHSMGGGIVLLTAASNKKIHSVCTWASVVTCTTPFTNWDADKIKEWERSGIAYYYNGRTKQNLPIHYQLYSDYQIHKNDYDLKNAAQNIQIPWLICHGTADTSVPFSAAELLKENCPDAQLLKLDTDHVFGRKHPCTGEPWPLAFVKLLDATMAFFKTSLKHQ